MERFHWEISSSMKEIIIRFNWGTKRENLHFFFGQREKWPKTGAFARHIHVYLSIESTPPTGFRYGYFRDNGRLKVL